MQESMKEPFKHKSYLFSSNLLLACIPKLHFQWPKKVIMDQINWYSDNGGHGTQTP